MRPPTVRVNAERLGSKDQKGEVSLWVHTGSEGETYSAVKASRRSSGQRNFKEKPNEPHSDGQANEKDKGKADNLHHMENTWVNQNGKLPPMGSDTAAERETVL